MSSNPTPSVQGTQAPSPIELIWDRYKSIAYVVVLAAFGALGINYALKYFSQKEIDATWSSFSTTLGMDVAYTDSTKSNESLTERLASIDAAKLKAALAAGPDAQKPFLLMALARKAVLDKDWEAAESSLRELETKYPNHSLVISTSHPVQAQEFVKDDEPNEPPQAKPKKPEFKPVQPGSAVGLMRAQIALAKGYAPPSQFAKHEIPADATKVKFELSGGYGSFTIALMPQSPLHRDAFLKLAQAETPFWNGLAVDEIRRPAKFFQQPHELHLGFESTKEDDRTKWNDTDPSKNPVEFEKNSLSHFAGAVSARNEKDGKSCADRFWIAVDDAPRYDGDRVIFAYVVEGLDNLKRVCEATMTAQEEEQGRGKPSETIRVTAVTVVK